MYDYSCRKPDGFPPQLVPCPGIFPVSLPECKPRFRHKRGSGSLPLLPFFLPGTPETLHMFDAARLARCKQGAILLNVGRGSTVDCLALADAVHSGHLFGAALDVTDPEPLPSDHPLWSEPNVIITPHISGRFSLAKTLDNIVEIFIHNLKLYAAGQPVDNQVSRTTHYVSGGSGGQRLVCGMP